MTAQFSDPLNYAGQIYSIAGVNGRGLFDPTEHCMKPVGRCKRLLARIRLHVLR